MIERKRDYYYSKKTITGFLLPLVKNKVVTEYELIRKMGNLKNVESSYKSLVIAGFPIRKRHLYNEGASRGSRTAFRKVNRRIIIYYLG